MIPTADKWGRTHASKTHDKRHRSPQARKTKADGDNDEHGHDDDHANPEQSKHEEPEDAADNRSNGENTRRDATKVIVLIDLN